MLLPLLKKLKFKFSMLVQQIFISKLRIICFRKKFFQYGILRLLRNTYNAQKMIDASTLNYTIYVSFENITQLLKFVKLMDLNIENFPNKSIKIYLG